MKSCYNGGARMKGPGIYSRPLKNIPGNNDVYNLNPSLDDEYCPGKSVCMGEYGGGAMFADPRSEGCFYPFYDL